MEFDAGSKFLFLGDYSGSIYILRLMSANLVQLVSKLSAHTGNDDNCYSLFIV
jgi:hypothetical protein